MKYIAFTKSVAQMAATYINNHCVAKGSALRVEHIAPHVLELPLVVGESDMLIVQPLMEQFGGAMSDVVPPPIDFYDPKPRTRRKALGEYDVTTKGERDRTLDGRGRYYERYSLSSQLTAV